MALWAFSIDGTDERAFNIPNWVTDANESNEGFRRVHWWMQEFVNEFHESTLLTNNTQLSLAYTYTGLNII